MRTKIDEFNKNEKSLLLFFEDCLVNKSGRVSSVHMNKEDMIIAEKFVEEGLIDFGRLTFEIIEKFKKMTINYNLGPTHWVRFTDEAWILAHQLRKIKSNKYIESIKQKLEEEMTCHT